MATIIQLAETGGLEKLDVALGPRELEQRCIYFLPQAANGLSDRLMAMVSEWNLEMEPAAQFDDLTHNFVTGGELNFPRQFNVLHHRRDGIWELKSADLRLFGWFADVDVFICSDVASATDVKEGPLGAANSGGSLYAGYCEQAHYRRGQLDLNEPKYIPGERPTDVVSNCAVEQP